MQSDIMIVKISEADYYVSEKLHDKEPYHKLLVIRSQNSKHFTSLSEARIMAERMKNYVIKTSPDCAIVEIDIKQYPKNNKPKKIPIAYEYDEDNQAVFGISDKGQKVFEFKKDAPYLYIDLIKYRNKLGKKHIVDNCDSDLNFRSLGSARAYKLAYNCALPYLRYEKYKTKKLLKQFEYDLELHKFDIEFYLGYIDGLNDAIAIQKDSVLQSRTDWQIHIFDLNNAHEFEIVQNYINLTFGEYYITLHKFLDNFVSSNKPNEIFIFFVDKVTNKSSLLSSFKIDTSQLIIYDTTKAKKTINNTHIEQLIEKLFKLGKGDEDLKVNEQWLVNQND